MRVKDVFVSKRDVGEDVCVRERERESGAG